MTRKTFVIDTNVLLHDPDAISKFHDNDVMIPLNVLEELDSMKRLSDELGKNARHILRYIDALKEMKAGDLHNGVKIENGIVVRVLVDMKPGGKTTFPLSPERSANKILLVAYKLREAGRSRRDRFQGFRRPRQGGGDRPRGGGLREPEVLLREHLPGLP